MKIVLIVIDSLGVGEMPDANEFNDCGSNTYLNVYNQTSVELPNLASLGLNNIDGINLSQESTIGSYCRLKELTKAKDTTAGHYEICGLILKQPYPTFPLGFPADLIEKLEKATDTKFIGNKVASGTEIIKEYGAEHIQNRTPIVYTSADSVLQVACHTDAFSLEQLYDICSKIREVCDPKTKYNIGRIIARPFATDDQGNFYRLPNRRDYALTPPEDTMLDKLKNNGFDTVCIGKIEDIFCQQGITESYHTTNNADSIKEIIKQTSRQDINGLIFANLNDTDMLYGHRNDYIGYANALKVIDQALPDILNNLNDEDILLITGDHGCDPTTPSTDHSREYTPLLIYSRNLQGNINLGTLDGFNNISNSILDILGIEKHNSIFDRLRKEK